MNSLEIIKKNREFCSEIYALQKKQDNLTSYDLEVSAFIDSLPDFDETFFLSFLNPEVINTLPLSSLKIFNKYNKEIKNRKISFLNYNNRKLEQEFLSQEPIFNIINHYPQLLNLDELLYSNYNNVYFLELLKLKKEEISQIQEVNTYIPILSKSILNIIHQKNTQNIIQFLTLTNPKLISNDFYKILFLEACSHLEKNYLDDIFNYFTDLSKKQNDKELFSYIFKYTWHSYSKINYEKLENQHEKAILFLLKIHPTLDLSQDFLKPFIHQNEDLSYAEFDGYVFDIKSSKINFFIHLVSQMNTIQKQSFTTGISSLLISEKRCFDKYFNFLNEHFYLEQNLLNKNYESKDVKKQKI